MANIINGEKVLERIDELKAFLEFYENKAPFTAPQEMLYNAAKNELEYLSSLHV